MEKIKMLNVTKYIGDRKIIDIDNLSIQENQKVGIVGKKGAA